ncbi:MAG: DUF4170 domain-containing protein [Rhodospirillaceae bacterium]
MSEQKFYVIGGEYADTSFREPYPGTKLETYGPFATEREAKLRWRELTGQSIDNAMVRYFISSDEPGAATRKNFWVVGGEYADSSFTRLASGAELEVYGPFEQSEALGFWRALAAKTMDDALMRYDIRENYEAGDSGTRLGAVRLAPSVTKSIAIAAAPSAVFKHLMEARSGRSISRSDAATGVIDHTLIDAAGHHWTVAARVVAAGGGAVYIVTYTKPTMVPDAEFSAAMRRVDDELSALKRSLER